MSPRKRRSPPKYTTGDRASNPTNKNDKGAQGKREAQAMTMSRNHRKVKERIVRLKRQWAAENAPCHLCKNPIDYSIAQGQPGAVEADHITPIANGGHVLGPMLASHRDCNVKRQNKDIDEFRTTRNIRIDDQGKPTEVPEVKRPLLW